MAHRNGKITPLLRACVPPGTAQSIKLENRVRYFRLTFRFNKIFCRESLGFLPALNMLNRVDLVFDVAGRGFQYDLFAFFFAHHGPGNR